MITITDKEYLLFERLKIAFKHANPDKSGLYFICGQGGPVDEVGLPETITICPTIGSDIIQVYKKVKSID